MKVLIFVLLFLTSLQAYKLDEIKKNDELRVGILSSNYPLSAYQEGEFVGFEVELAKEITKELLGSKDKVNFIPLNIGERTQAVKDNLIDIILGNYVINKTTYEIDFTVPYFFVNTAVLSKKSSDIESIKDLRTETLGLINKSFTEKSLGNLNYVAFDCESIEFCLQALNEDKIIAIVGDDIILYRFLSENASLEIPIKRIGKVDFLAIGVMKDNKRLIEALNRILLKLHKNGTIGKIYENILEPLQGNFVDSSEFLFVDIYNEL